MIIVNDQGWPEWMRQSFDFLEAKQLGDDFMRALEWWTVIERSYNWESSGKGLSPAHRPEEVAHWLKVLRRNIAKSPVIKDEVSYAEKWWKWWAGLQPSWRIRDAQLRPVIGGEGDWEALKKPGKNGLLMVLLSLAWWSDAATAATRSQWDIAVKDVSWVMVSMGKGAASSAGATERKRSSSMVDDQRRASKRSRRS
ncbi:hypothetical protein OH76DRAFT_1459537 [Lentinus brumalis]|uniref:Uncharacterized protein n=1 Tax=Lentinus brumalis TaxID=2498619 RepID=A0A371CJ63_9APHY|nr:hypothetical protein OH76DRAFT_1459537 [Polyporus brumalis]